MFCICNKCIYRRLSVFGSLKDILSMFYNDYKIPKYLEEIRDDMLSDYIHYISQNPSIKITSNLLDKMSKVVGCFLYNTIRPLCYGNNEVIVILDQHYFSNAMIYNCKKINRKVSYKYFRSYLDYLQSVGYVELIIGQLIEWELKDSQMVPTKASSSKIIIKPDLIEKLLPYAERSKLWTTPSVIEVRNKEKQVVTKNVTPKVTQAKNILNRYNKFIQDVNVSVQDKLFDIQLKRIYNKSSFELGGRMYMIGGGIQNIIELQRKEILIDGEETVELDYMSLHPRLAAEIDGEELDDDFDPYGITLDGYDKTTLRWFAKIAVMMMLYTKRGGHHTAFNNYLSELEDPSIEDLVREGLTPERINAREIFEHLICRNPYLVPWFDGEPKAYELQNLDSEIMLYILDYTSQRGVHVLPVHDSVVCKKKDKDFVEDVMYKAYHHVMGSSMNCVVKLK